jgi:transposase
MVLHHNGEFFAIGDAKYKDLDGLPEPSDLYQQQLRPRHGLPRAGRHHGILVTQMLGHVDFVDTCIAEMDARIAVVLAPHQELVERVTTIPGVKQRSAEALIAECGMDMAPFPSTGHLASWAGICPGNHASAGKRRSGRTRKGPKWLRTALTESAQGAARARNTYLAAHFSQIMGRRGRPKAIGAIRHDSLVAYYFIIRDRVNGTPHRRPRDDDQRGGDTLAGVPPRARRGRRRGVD